VELHWDTPAAAGAVTITEEGRAATGIAGRETWVSSRETLGSSGSAKTRFYWRLAWDAQRPERTTKKSCVGVLLAAAPAGSSVDVFETPGSWAFRNSKDGGRTVCNGEVENEEEQDGPQLYDYYNDTLGLLLDTAAGSLTLYVNGRRQRILLRLPRNTALRPAVGVLDAPHCYRLIAYAAPPVVRAKPVSLPTNDTNDPSIPRAMRERAGVPLSGVIGGGGCRGRSHRDCTECRGGATGSAWS